MNLNIGDTRLIIRTCVSYGLLRNQAAYVLATIYHETGGTMKPVRETFAESDAQAIARLTKAWKSGKLPWVSKDYWTGGWFGRGHVQLTHLSNYQKAKDKTGIDFVSHPEYMLQSDKSVIVSVQGMQEGWFTGKKLSDYITLSKSDFKGARRIINGTDKADLIAGYANSYNTDLIQVGYGVKPIEKPVQEIPVVPAPAQPEISKPSVEPSVGLLKAIMDLLLKIFGGKNDNNK